MHIESLIRYVLLGAVFIVASPASAQDSSVSYGPRISDLEKARLENPQSPQIGNPAPNDVPTYDENGNLIPPKPDTFTHQYDKIYKKTPKIEDDKDERTPLARGSYHIYLARVPGGAADAVTLRLSSPVSVTGCLKMKLPKVEIAPLNGPVMRFKVTDGKAELDRTIRYAPFLCPITGGFMTADIPLSRDQLIQNDIKTIALESEFSVTDRFDVDVNSSRLILTPKTRGTAFKAFDGVGGKSAALVFNFYPENTVVLYASAPSDVSDAIKGFAAEKNLAVVDVPTDNVNRLYFTDAGGSIAKRLSPGMAAAIGTLGAPAPGARAVTLYARLPGLYD